jgi:hypothetical protein
VDKLACLFWLPSQHFGILIKTVSNFCQQIRGDICKSTCTTGINDTGGKFATGVNDTGGKQWEQLSNC